MTQINTAAAAAIIGSSVAAVGNLLRNGVLPARRASSTSNRPSEWLLDDEDVMIYALTTPVRGRGPGSAYRPVMRRSTLPRLLRNLRARYGNVDGFAIYEHDGAYLAYAAGSDGAREAGLHFRLVNTVY